MSTQSELDDKLLKLCMLDSVKNNKAKQVQALIDKGANVNASTSQRHSALYLACRENSLDVVQTLLANGAKTDSQDRSKMSPLHIASQNGNLEITRALIAAGADIEAENTHGERPIFRACIHGHTEVGIELIKAGCSLGKNPRSGIGPLDYVGAESISNWYESHLAQKRLADAFQDADQPQATMEPQRSTRTPSL